MVRMYVERSKAKTFFDNSLTRRKFRVSLTHGNPDYGTNSVKSELSTIISRNRQKRFLPQLTVRTMLSKQKSAGHLSLRFVGFMFLFLIAVMIICEDSFSICFLPVQKMQVFPEKKCHKSLTSFWSTRKQKRNLK